MKRSWRVMVLSAAWVVISVGTVSAQSTENLVGTWTLVSAFTEQGGTTTETYGPNPRGILIMSDSGRYAIAAMRVGLPRLASNDRETGTPEENQAIVAGSIAHFGTLSVNATETAIILKVDAATFPNWDGTEQNWPFTLVGDELEFTVPAASGGGTAVTVWRRAT